MQNFKYSLFVTLILFIFPSAVYALSDEVKNRAQLDLQGECLDLFTRSGSVIFNQPTGYQYYGIEKYKVFYIANNTQGQRCFYNHIGILNAMSKASKVDFENAVLEQCNTQISDGPGASCELYARNNEIVYLRPSERLKNAENSFASGDLLKTTELLKDIEKTSLSKLNHPQRSKFEYLLGKSLAETDSKEALKHFYLGWTRYSNPVAAAEEASLLIKLGRTQTDWQSVRNAYEFFFSNSNEEEKLLYPNAKENYLLTDSYFVANEEIKKKEQLEQKRLAEIEEKEMAKRQRLAEIESEKESKRRAAEQRIEDVKAQKEAKKLAEQERIKQIKIAREVKEEERRRLSEERRLAKEGDGSSDDYTCKSLGARPGTTPYVQCRLKLTEQINQRQQNQMQAIKQQEEIKRLQAEQERRYQEQQEMQERLEAEQARRYQEQREIQQRLQAQEEARQDAADRRRRLEALGQAFRAIQGLDARSVPSTPTTMPHFLRSQYYSNGNHMCNYDDGSTINVGAGICPIQR